MAGQGFCNSYPVRELALHGPFSKRFKNAVAAVYDRRTCGKCLRDGPIQLICSQTMKALKRAAGRPKDLESLAELQALLEEQKS